MDTATQEHTILIAEDDDQIAYLLQFMLERESFKVALASDGQQAMDMINSLPPPDLILLDIMLPFVDGFELIKHIRSQDEWKSVPILMLSSKSQEKDIVHALNFGANDYIVKPFHPLELVARIRRHLS